MDMKLPESMEPKMKAMSVEAKPSAINRSNQSECGNGTQPDSESGHPAAEEGKPRPWLDGLADFLLPEVPPGNLEKRTCGIPKRFTELIKYFVPLIYSTVSGWYAFSQYHATVSASDYFGPPFDYMWLASLVLLVVYNVIGPLPRALGDLLCCSPGGYYRYKLHQNDYLNRSFARVFMLMLTTLSTFIQFGTFYLSFETTVVNKGVKIPAALVAIVPKVLEVGSVAGINSVTVTDLREALYSDPHEGGSKRRSARQKLVGRFILAKVILWAIYGGFLITAYITAARFGSKWRSN